MFRRPFGWREMERLRRDMDRLFESSLPRAQRQRAAGFPAMNVWTNEKEGILVTAELPGMEPGEVDISVTADTLTISGQRMPVETAENVKYHRKERSYGEFSRTFQLPFTVNREMVEANMERGCLRISMPRAEAEKPKKIAVNVG